MRLRRKKVNKTNKIKKWKASLAAKEAYTKIYDKWMSKKKAAAHEAKVARKASQTEKPKVVEKVVEKPKVAATKKAAKK